MAFKITCLVLSLAVVCYGYPSGFDDFGNIGKAFGSALSEAQEGISGALSETKDALSQAGKETSDALNQAGKDISSDPGVKDAADLFGGFGKAFGGGSARERPALTTPKSIFDEDNSKSAYERSSDIDSAFGRSSFGSSSFGSDPFRSNSFGSNGFGSNSFGSSGFGSSGFGSSSNFGRRDPFDNGFGSSFGQSGFGSNGFGNNGFGSSGGFGGYNGFGGSRW